MRSKVKMSPSHLALLGVLGSELQLERRLILRLGEVGSSGAESKSVQTEAGSVAVLRPLRGLICPPPPPGTRGSNWRDSCSSCTDHRVPGSARWLPFCPGVGVGRPPDAPLLSRGPGPKPPTPPSGKEQEDTWGRVLLRQCPPGSKVTNGWIKR